MNIETLNFNSFKMAVVEKETPIVALLLSADIHFENSPKQQVLSSIFADMLQAGAGKYKRDDFLYEISLLGARLETTVLEGRVIISLQVLQANLTKTLKLLEAILLTPLFSENELERVKQRLISNLTLYKENSQLLAFDNLKKELFGEKDRKYRFAPDVLSVVVPEITVEDLKKMHEGFKQSFWRVGLGGSNNSIKTVTKILKNIKTEVVTENAPAKEPKSVKTSILITEEVSSKKNIDVSIGAPLPFLAGERDLAIFRFGLAVFGKWGGFAGRLMSTVREKEGLTYTIYARDEGIEQKETGFWRIISFFSPKDIEAGLTSVLRELRKLQDKGITEAELKTFRNILKTGEKLANDSLVAMVSLAHRLMVLDMEYSDYQKYKEDMYTCSRAEINRILKQYLQPEKVVFSLAGPIKDIKLANLKKLIKAKK